MTYLGELGRAMLMLAEGPRVLFVGQSVAYPGQRAHATFDGIAADRKVEMPIVEDFTVGYCAGMALSGALPVCFIPRMDFLILAMNAIVNHLDKLPVMGATPKVIIRTAVGASSPLDPGPQHTQNHIAALKMMLRSVEVIDLPEAADVMPGYQRALAMPGSCIVVEHMSEY